MLIDSSTVEPLVRAAIGNAMRISLQDWPADRPLEEVPDGIFDSLVRLDAVARLEQKLGAGSLDLEKGAGRLGSIASITDWIVSELGARA
ncbi:hypothetical protein [Saccharopolyspora spinosa]|uniref:Acyl carrier protein n=1 Tax=Saccharopolyspora spinosa TaxID=60894 RepID=A0A2N3Y577_SACSN|nr:hypothetical protein [Saccharopolyspora spinosa]PKW18033.1 hypothetical protein A8926_6087 [Saccharopolyspora spinosa]